MLKSYVGSLSGGPPGGLDDFPCGIIILTYGTPLEKKISVLRGFRNKLLRTNSVGRAIEKLYYQNSPSLARYVSGKLSLKKISLQTLSSVIKSVEFMKKYHVANL